MELSDRSNWLLSGLVGALVLANGIVIAVHWGARLTGLFAGGAIAVGGALVLTTAVRAVRDPTAIDQEWTGRKTALNAVAVVVLSFGLVAALLSL